MYPFEYNQFDQLEQLVDEHDIGVIKMEVQRNVAPQNQFLQKVRQLATQRGIVLIFDECTSGFRESFGGIHKNHDVEPDIAIFAKLLAMDTQLPPCWVNESSWKLPRPRLLVVHLDGADLTAARGSRCHGANQILVEDHRNRKSHLGALGKLLADKYGLAIDVYGLPALAGFAFESPHAQAYKTLITRNAQEALSSR